MFHSGVGNTHYSPKKYATASSEDPRVNTLERIDGVAREKASVVTGDNSERSVLSLRTDDEDPAACVLEAAKVSDAGEHPKDTLASLTSAGPIISSVGVYKTASADDIRRRGLLLELGMLGLSLLGDIDASGIGLGGLLDTYDPNILSSEDEAVSSDKNSSGHCRVEIHC